MFLLVKNLLFPRHLGSALATTSYPVSTSTIASVIPLTTKELKLGFFQRRERKSEINSGGGEQRFHCSFPAKFPAAFPRRRTLKMTTTFVSRRTGVLIVVGVMKILKSLRKPIHSKFLSHLESEIWLLLLLFLLKVAYFFELRSVGFAATSWRATSSLQGSVHRFFLLNKPPFFFFERMAQAKPCVRIIMLSESWNWSNQQRGQPLLLDYHGFIKIFQWEKTICKWLKNTVTANKHLKVSNTWKSKMVWYLL